jgi:hypothetical protein
MHAVSLGCDPQALTLADPASAVHRGGGGSGGLPTLGRPMWCIEVEPDSQAMAGGSSCQSRCQTPVAPQAKQAVTGVPGTPAAPRGGG